MDFSFLFSSLRGKKCSIKIDLHTAANPTTSPSKGNIFFRAFVPSSKVLCQRRGFRNDFSHPENLFKTDEPGSIFHHKKTWKSISLQFYVGEIKTFR